MSDERFLNSYHNASTPPGPDVPAELAAFMLAVDPVLIQAAELARVLARAHQGAATQLIGEGWPHARKYFSLSEKYAEWADYRQPPGTGQHGRDRDPGLNARTSGVYLRADPSDLQVLDGGSEEERAQLIAQRLREWKSAANAF